MSELTDYLNELVPGDADCDPEMYTDRMRMAVQEIERLSSEVRAAFLQGAMLAWEQFEDGRNSNGPHQGWLLEEAEKAFASEWWPRHVKHTKELMELASVLEEQKQ